MSGPSNDDDNDDSTLSEPADPTWRAAAVSMTTVICSCVALVCIVNIIANAVSRC